MVCTSIISVTHAKYTTNKKIYNGIDASDFHMSSNILKEVNTANPNGAVYDYYSWPATIEVELYNWDLDNTLSYTSANIDYTVVIEGATFDDEGRGRIDENTTGNRHNTSKIIVVPVSDDIPEIIINVHVLKPYPVVYRAVLTLAGIPNNSYYEVVDKLFYYELIVYAANDLTNITITWPTNVSPDNNNTDVDMVTWVGNSATVSRFEKGKSYSMCFFKNGLIDIPLNDVIITSNGTIIIGTNSTNSG